MRNVRPERNTVPKTVSVDCRLWDGVSGRTEPDALSVDIDVDTQERRKAGRKEQVETRDPAADDGALLQALLRELPARRNNR